MNSKFRTCCQIKLYVFGADEPISDLRIIDWEEWEYWPTAVEPVLHKGYVAYTFEVFPSTCFHLDSDRYSFSDAGLLCTDRWEEFVVHAADSEAAESVVLLQLYDYDLKFNNGELQGSVRFYAPGEYTYSASIFDREGNRESCTIDSSPGEAISPDCPPVANPSHLQIFARDADGEYPTNLVFRLDDVRLPGNITVTDHNGNVEAIELEIGFDGSGEDESEIALYRIVQTSWDDSTTVRHVPADESSSYSVRLRNLNFSFFNNYNYYDYGVIQLVDKEGHPFIQNVYYEVVDSTSGRREPLNYESFKISNHLEHTYEPEYKAFADADKTAGGRAGVVEWTMPDFGDYDLLAYDLYYADADYAYLQGVALAYFPYNVPYVLPSTFRHTLRDVPENAEYLAVVPILEENFGGGYFTLHHADPFHVQLVDRVAPTLTSLVVGAAALEPVDSVYTHTVDHDTDVVTVTAEAGSHVEINLNGTVGDGSVTAAIEITEDEMSIPITLFDRETNLSGEYTLRIVRIIPDSLVLGVGQGWLKPAGSGDGTAGYDYEYGFVPRGMTAEKLKAYFVLVKGTSTVVVDRNGSPVEDWQPVPAGSTLVLNRGEKNQSIKLHLLSEHVRSSLELPPEPEPITLLDIAAYALKAGTDVTGDGVFDRRDLRLLLNELE